MDRLNLSSPHGQSRNTEDGEGGRGGKDDKKGTMRETIREESRLREMEGRAEYESRGERRSEMWK